MSVRDVVQAAAGALGGDKVYVEDVFSTYLYTGNGSTQTITNDIDLDGEGGLVWFKRRSSDQNHYFSDTARGVGKVLSTNTDTQELNISSLSVSSFNSDGFGVPSGDLNGNGTTYASWTFRKAPKFFDVVTYTGNGTTQNIAHSLDSVPGCIIVKRTDAAENWGVYHRSIGATAALRLNQVAAPGTLTAYWNDTNPTSTQFTVGSNSQGNASGGTYVAYLFAHDDGGFGDDGEQNVISCGSYTSTGYPFSVTLGYEPQWVLVKKVSGSASGDGNWYIFDSMRGWSLNPTYQSVRLRPNTNEAEASQLIFYPTATGFEFNDVSDEVNFSGNTYIYIAIRRPMKTPEAGTEVFAVDFQGTGGVTPGYKASFPVDMGIWRDRDATANTQITSRLTNDSLMYTNNTNAEAYSTSYSFDYQNGFMDIASTDTTRVGWMFRRAPGFFDVVAYTGDGTSGKTVTHNLAVAPELLIARQRTGGDWYVYSSVTTATQYLVLNATDVAVTESSVWNDTAPTSSVFTLGNATGVNRNNTAFISHLFATLDGISKVGSYTGTGSDVNVDCGFSAGARFILIKRTDSAAGWYVWDSERGITAGNDPYLLLNSTDAEVTGTDYIDPLASGFTVTSSATSDLNASGGTYLFLAIA